MGFKQKIAAVVCIGFNAFTMEGKISRANDKLMNLKTPVLFIVGQNATTATYDFYFSLICSNVEFNPSIKIENYHFSTVLMRLKNFA